AARDTRRKERTAPVADSITLVGTMSYGKGPFAFFDSNNADHRKVTKVSDTIAGYKVEAIDQNDVKLAAGTNQLQMAVGMQLRREEGGSWLLTTNQFASDSSNGSGNSSLASADAPLSGTNSPPDTADSGDADAVLKRLMQRRNQENER